MRHEVNVNKRITITKIALTGKARAGKDEVARILGLHYGFNRFAFGDALKNTLTIALPQIMYAEQKPRRLLQEYGQLMRKYDPNVWVNSVAALIDSHIDIMTRRGDEEINVLVTDCRQPNEYAWLREQGFSIIRVSAPEEVRLERAKLAGDQFDEADLQHDTESHVDSFDVDFEIINDGTLDKLKTQVDEFMGALMLASAGQPS
ncbi:deoxynucleotide monophosphate kinase family protein [Bacillus chungangensis]|uniref:Dephospho-CoA kinase n=1 Tax=Bacillus chungangensis TaxID=587633 RepID=A0ABT9WMG9_9BACI|nr:hypothetical protein [Bacillus chungangensis]MDQ0174406.1 dephospho-CoA kinase [Bacillus chungangensis]